MTALAQQLAELPGMSPAQLRARWRECWRKGAPEIGPDLQPAGRHLLPAQHGPFLRELDNGHRLSFQLPARP